MNPLRFKWQAGGILLVLVGILVARTVVRADTAPADAKLAGTTAPLVVAAVRAERANLQRDTEYTAEMRPYLDTDLHAKVAGYLKSISVDIGDRVKAGQVIAVLELPEEEADLAKAQADFQVMKLNYDRITAVSQREPGLLAEQDVDKARGDYEVAEANLHRAQVLTSYAAITAPFSGIITKRYADPGAMIQAGTASSTQSMSVVHLAELDKLRLDFPVPQSVAAQIRPGDPVIVTIPTTGETIHAVVARDTGSVDMSTRMMTVEVDLDNRDLHLKPGMYATAKMNLASNTQALALPVQAVEFGETPAVWTIDATGELNRTAVKLGIQTPDKVEVLSGLQPSEAVVFGSHDNLRVGMKVSPKFVE